MTHDSKSERLLAEALAKAFVSFRDFPRPGINFWDLCPILSQPDLLRRVVAQAAHHARECQAQAIIGIESRGFLVGLPAALETHLPFVPARKRGKLPGPVLRAEYALEYGTDVVEIQKSAIQSNQRYLIIDDVLATGGTAHAVAACIRQGGGIVAGYSFVLEIAGLGGSARIAQDAPHAPVFTMLTL